MSTTKSRLRFNFGFLLEANLGTSRDMEIDYPTIKVADDVILSPLQGLFTVTRGSEGIYISGQFNSRITAECMRCLVTTEIAITFNIDELFYYPPSTASEGDYSLGDDGFIDLSPLVRELALLEVPITPVCRPDCQGLCMECGQNLNEADCGCEVEDIDPRLAVLKELLDN